MGRIVDIKGLAEALNSNRFTLRKLWRSYPHFFVGEGNDLRAARFDVDDVLEYLKKERGRNYECLERQEPGLVGCQVPASRETNKEGRIQNQTGSKSVGNRRKAKNNPAIKDDPWNLLPGTGN